MSYLQSKHLPYHPCRVIEHSENYQITKMILRNIPIVLMERLLKIKVPEAGVSEFVGLLGEGWAGSSQGSMGLSESIKQKVTSNVHTKMKDKMFKCNVCSYATSERAWKH